MQYDDLCRLRVINPQVKGISMQKFWLENRGKIAAIMTAAFLSVLAWANGLLDGVFGTAETNPPATSAPAEPVQ